jgi:dihydropyrimidine dehydrogenase (NAD+) subunit PreA
MGQAIGQDADLAARVTEWCVKAASVPVIAKMTPNVTDVGRIAKRCVEAGAASISAINTVSTIMGVDLETFSPLPNIGGQSTQGGMSGRAIKPIALRAVAQTAKAVNVPVSGIGGIYTWEDAAEFLLLGAQNVQICTAVMVQGMGIIGDLTKGLAGYLDRKGLGSVRDLVGLALPKLVDHYSLARETKNAAIDLALCIQCGQCVVACRDGGFSAIRLEADKTPVVDGEKCDGCGLCAQVCPVWGCVQLEA